MQKYVLTLTEKSEDNDVNGRAGMEESIVKTQMGHTDIKTTRDYYYFTTQNTEYKKRQISRAINQ